MNQFVAAETLKRVGCTCEVVGDGVLALEAVRRGQYDAVLMDCQMPNMDGLEATRRIRQWESATPGVPHHPIIALTAEAIQGDREKCLAAGMDDYVTKPLNSNKLFEAILTSIRRQGSAGEYVGRNSVEISDPSEVKSTMAEPIPPSTSAAAVPADSAPALVDMDAVLKRCGGDPKFTATVIKRFQSNTQSEVARIEQALAAGDAATLARAAHSLKSMTAYMSANTAMALARKIELLARDQKLAEIPPLFQDLKKEVESTTAFLEQYGCDEKSAA
jgi:CheY-like chemotaxis protein